MAGQVTTGGVLSRTILKVHVVETSLVPKVLSVAVHPTTRSVVVRVKEEPDVALQATVGA